MKLYYAENAPAGERWTGTQADDKAVRKQHGGDMVQREVPTDKPNLIQFLNAEERITSQQSAGQREPDELEKAEMRAVAAAGASTTMPDHAERNWEATDIEAFILERATVAQASRIFECLGTRFKELANERG